MSVVYNALFYPSWSAWFPAHNPDRFRFDSTKLPLTSQSEVLYTLVGYLVAIHLGQRILSAINARPVTLKWLFFLHNALLSAGSALLLALIVEIMAPRVISNGLMWSVCHEDMYDNRLEFLFYLNYLFKYYELLDTVFLVLKRKPVPFLHWFHHSMTMLLCYVQLEGRTTMSIVPIVLNLTVHVIMYYYYARTSVSTKRIWWKRHLTTMQIIQFIVDMLAIGLAFYARLVDDNFAQLERWLGFPPPAPTWGVFGAGQSAASQAMAGKRATCAGKKSAGYVGMGLIASYLLLFIQFFRQTYSSGSGKPSTVSVGVKGRAKKD